MSESKEPIKSDVGYWSPPLPWLAPRCILANVRKKGAPKERPIKEEVKEEE